MQSTIAEDRLAQLLLETGELERRVEVTRQVLVENKDFEPNLCFNTLTQYHWRDYFQQRDLQEFLNFHGVDPHPEFLALLFNSLDKNRDGAVNWEEFLDTVMAKECGNPVYYKNRHLLSVELEHSLFRVFQVELEGLADLDRLKEELYLYPTYSAVTLFESLDRSKKGFLDVYDLQQFLSAYSTTMTFAKAERVLRRIDQDFDGRINFEEFLEFARPSAYPRNVYVERAGRTLSYSIARRFSPERSAALRESPVRSSPYRQAPARSPVRSSPYRQASRSPVRVRSPLRRVYEPLVRNSPLKKSINASYAKDTFNSSLRTRSPVRASPMRETMKSTQPPTPSNNDNQSQAGTINSQQSEAQPLNKPLQRTPQSAYSTPYRAQVSDNLYPLTYHLTNLQRSELVQTLKDIFVGNRELEALREDLSLRPDFNATELFEMAALDNGVDLSLAEFRRLANTSGASLLSEDAIFLFEQLDKNRDGFMSFQEFGELFAAKKPEYRNALQNRGRKDILRFDEYTLTTQNLVRDVIKASVETLNQAEISREIISERLYTLYRILDKNNDGYISFNELAEVLDDNGLEGVTYRELVEVIEGFDFNRDGKISFREFVEELSPKKGYSNLKTRLYYRM